MGHRVVVSELPTKVTHERTHHAMTHDHSALLAQLDALKSADAGVVFAELIRAGLQARIEAEAAAKISVPCTASKALLAVTTCLPLAIASITSVLAIP